MMGFALLYVLFGRGVVGSSGIFDDRRGGAGIWCEGNEAGGIRGENLVRRNGFEVGDMSGGGGGGGSM